MNDSPAPEAGSPPLLAIVCLSLAAGASAMAMRVNDALLPQLAQIFGVPLATTAQVVSFYALAYGASQVLWGPIGDRFGKYRVVAWAVLACALASLACAFAGDFGQLRAARVLAGMLAAAIIPLSIAWLGDVVPYERRQPVLARFLIGQITGLASGVWLGGVAADHLGWRVPYFVLAGLYGVVGAQLFVGLRRLPAGSSGRAGSAVASSLTRTLGDFREVLGGRWAQILLLIVFLEGSFLFGPLAFMAAHLHHRLGVSLTVAGSLVMVFGAGGLVYALGARRLVRGLGEAGLARAGALFLCLGLGAIAAAPSWIFGVLGSLLAGLGFYMLHNTLQVNATQMAPRVRGAAVSLFAASFFLGQSAGVTLIGWVSARIGSGPAIGLGAGALLGIGLGFGQVLVRRTAAQG
ncbi:MFS transporter [Immundisolibacter sp.]|uniref:MFS transporter n=1 Tax=Immundisolibacter sp. TaxID=1934948 RepID=UPI002B1B115A|nr:MFS transporter [Immundisolibacter sp.]MEA3219443.1 putative multidrug resistance protein MdtD [Immundisolibacter sp.]